MVPSEQNHPQHKEVESDELSLSVASDIREHTQSHFYGIDFERAETFNGIDLKHIEKLKYLEVINPRQKAKL